MDVAEANDSQRRAEPELTFQRDGMRLAAERTPRLATRKELEEEGTADMDDCYNDGRGVRMASEGAGQENGPMRRMKAEVRTLNKEETAGPWKDERCTERFEPELRAWTLAAQSDSILTAGCGILGRRSNAMIEIKYTGDALWERIERAVEKVKDRLRRVTSALNDAHIPFAVIGGNAVQLWVAQVDESAVRKYSRCRYCAEPRRHGSG
jgi:hypothetical protein